MVILGWGTRILRYGVFADFCRFSPMFADFCKIWQIWAKFGKIFGLTFRARWAIFHILTQNLEKLDPGAVFAPRECFFSDSSHSSHKFGLIFVDIRASWGVFGRLFCFLGRFPAKSPQSRQVCCFAKRSHHTPI